VKEENRHLAQRLAQLQQTVYEQQRDLERWQSAQEELLWLRTAVQALQREREVIRARLAAMLVTIERLEQLSQMPTPAAPAEGS
ncbi:MAG: hypothetical protein ONB06_07025, partial [candidate division KSB1 bacterium]|nr:hypothetical protein [candidate division KSB1 bacterium]